VHDLPVGGGRGCVEAPFTCGLAQTRSLVVELTFYALLPFYALAAARLTRGMEPRRWMRAELSLLALLAALSVTLLVVAPEPLPRVVIRSALGYGLWFALGMGMAVASVRFEAEERPPKPLGWLVARPGLVWLAALAGYVALCLSLPGTPFVLARGQIVAVHLAFGAISALLLFPAVFAGPSRRVPRRVLSHPVVAWLGLVSYGIFLWHYVVTLELGSPGAGAPFGLVLLGTLAIAVACAAVSYYAVERPILRLKTRPLSRARGRGAASRRSRA
jgi:peptidoglycan/LPS O-acetylase OafA/YrhL